MGKQIAGDDTTPLKQSRYREVCVLETKVWMAVLAKQRRQKKAWLTETIHVFDLYGGPGAYSSGMKGSPVIASEVLRRCGAYGYVVAFEEEIIRARQLRQALAPYASSARVYQASNGRFFDVVGTRGLSLSGWVYVDPSGPSELNMDLLARIGREPRTRYLDVVMSLPVHMLKRCRHLEGMPSFDKIRQAVQKKRVMATRAHHRNGWTMVVFTNGPQGDYGDMIDLASERGRYRLLNMRYTRREREQQQPGLFDGN